MGSRSKERRARRTGWHPGFAQLAIERRPGNFEVLSEFQLSQDPRRGDLLLVRRLGEAVGRPAQTLRGLWPLIPRVGLVQLPVLGEVTAPPAVLIRPDGYVAWVGDLTDPQLPRALATWFGAVSPAR